MGGTPTPIITLPTVVPNAMDAFIAKFFTHPPQRDHVANNLAGLMTWLGQNHHENDWRTFERLRFRRV
jgi:hypothetical protein